MRLGRTKFRATANYVEEGTANLSTIMPSNQKHVTQARDGQIELNVPLSSALIGVNPNVSGVFIWGKSIWGDSTNFVPTFDYIKGGMSDGYGNLTSDPVHNDFLLIDWAKYVTTKTIEAKPLKFTVRVVAGATNNFTIYFDRGWGVYGTRIKVDGVQYFNDSETHTHIGEQEKSSFDIEITHCNVSKSPIVVLAVFSGLSQTFDRENGLINFTISNRNSFNTRSIGEWGIVTQQGDMNVLDKYSIIRDLQELGILQNQQLMLIEMSYDDSAGKEQWKTIGKLNSRFDYTFGSKEVPIALTGRVEDWHNIVYGGMPLVANIGTGEIVPTRGINMLRDLLILTGRDFTITPAAVFRLQSLIIRYPYLDSSTLFEAINKILYIGMCVLWEDETGQIFVDLFAGTKQIQASSPVYRIDRTNTYGNLQGKYNDYINGVEVVNNNVTFTENQQVFSLSEMFYVQDTGTRNPNNYEYVVTKRTFHIGPPVDFYYIKIPIFFDNDVVGLSLTSSNKVIYLASSTATLVVSPTSSGSNRIIIWLEQELKDGDSTDAIDGVSRDVLLYCFGRCGYLYINAMRFDIDEYGIGEYSINTFSYTISLSGTIFGKEEQIKQFGTYKSDIKLTTSELMQVDTTYDGVPIAQNIAETLIETERGKQAIELQVQMNDYYAYDRNGHRTGILINSEIGETFKVGQFVEIWDDVRNAPFIRDRAGDVKIFEVREVIKEKHGAPLMITLRLREV